MPIPRQISRFLQQMTRRGPNISPATRTQIISKRAAGCTLNELAHEFQRSVSAIRYTLRTYPNAATTQEKPRSGRPHILSERQKRMVKRAVQKAPTIEYSELKEVGVMVDAKGTPSKPPSRSTLYRTLKGQGLTNFRPIKRPKLTPEHARQRLLFARQYRGFPWGRRTLKFSDECSIQKGSGHEQEWCFRYPWQKWNREMISPQSTSRKPAQMVWASIWLDERGQPRRSPLVIMKRDSNAPHNGYSAQSYIDTLQKGLLPT
jgi:transposase